MTHFKTVIAFVAFVFSAYPADAKPSKRDSAMIRCMGLLSDIKDVKLRAWCFKQSARMP